MSKIILERDIWAIWNNQRWLTVIQNSKELHRKRNWSNIWRFLDILDYQICTNRWRIFRPDFLLEIYKLEQITFERFQESAQEH